MINKLRRFFAEILFEQELDQDYWMGIREGAETLRKSDKIRLQLLYDTALKKDQPGIAKAMQLLAKEEL